MVSLAGEVRFDQPPDKRRLEIAALKTGGRQQRVSEQFPEVPPEPDTERDAESLLRPIEDLLWQQRRRHFLENVLPAPIRDLQGRRKAGGERNDLVVEQWHARFNGMRHAHAVHFRQHVLWQIGFRVEAHHLSRPRQVCIAFEMACEPHLRIAGVECAQDVARQQRGLFVGAEEPD